MSGIFGIWNLDGQPMERAMLSKLASIQGHRNQDGEGAWIEGDVGLVFQNLWVTPESVGEIQPFIRNSESVVLFEGRLDNREELLSVLGDRVSAASSDAAFVSAVYRKFGEGFPEKLLGDFATAVYDIRDRKLLLARDSIGVRPLYFAQAGNSFLIASECKPILAHPKLAPKPNADMVAAYFLACFGQEREGWTFFEGISSVLPGQLVVIRPGAVKKRIYWDFQVPQPIRLKAFADYAEAFRHHFEQAVARRIRSAYPVAVSLSGGVDSSSVFCMAETLRRQRPGVPIIQGISVEYDAPLAIESTYLNEIERLYGTAIHRIPLVFPSLIQGSARDGLLARETPYLRGTMDSNPPAFETARQLGARVMLTGHWGDQMLARRDYWLDLFRQGRWLTIWNHAHEFARGDATVGVDWFLKTFRGQLLRSYIPPSWMPLLRKVRSRVTGDRSWFTDRFWQGARQAERLQQFAFAGETAYQRSVYEIVRPMYYGITMEWVNKSAAHSHIEHSYPFFDRDLISFLMAIPGEVPSWGGVPKALLRSAMTGILPAGIAGRRSKGETTSDFNQAVDQAFDGLAPIFQGDVLCVGFGYVDGPGLKDAMLKLRSRLHQEGCLFTWQLADLFGLELWLQSFFGTKIIDLEEFAQDVTAHA